MKKIFVCKFMIFNHNIIQYVYKKKIGTNCKGLTHAFYYLSKTVEQNDYFSNYMYIVNQSSETTSASFFYVGLSEYC